MSDDVQRFGPFVLDSVTGRLTRDGVPVPLGQKALAVLRVLAGAQGAAVGKDALLAAAWPGVTVEEGNLTVQISALRKALGLLPDGGEWIITLPRQGYRLVMGADRVPDGPLVLPRLAVLPFRALGEDTGDSYLADGIVEDLTTALGRFRSFAVIARGAAFAERGRDDSAQAVASRIAADYLLTGSLRRAGGRLRIVARLVAGDTGTQIWGATLEGSDADVFALQDEITAAVAVQVAPEIEAAEIDRSLRDRSTSLAAHDLYLRALQHLYAETVDGNAEAIGLLDRALELAPDNAVYLSRASWAREHRITVGWPALGPDDRARCLDHAERGLALAQGDARVMAHCAMSILQVGEARERAMDILHRAAELNPHNAMVLLAAGVANLHFGPIEVALGHLRRVVALSPGDPMLHIAWCAIGHAELARGDAGAALAAVRRSLAINGHFDPAHWVMTAAAAHLGLIEEARESLARFRALSPEATIARIRAAQPTYDPTRMARVLDGLRLAGLPEG